MLPETEAETGQNIVGNTDDVLSELVLLQEKEKEEKKTLIFIFYHLYFLMDDWNANAVQWLASLAHKDDGLANLPTRMQCWLIGVNRRYAAATQLPTACFFCAWKQTLLTQRTPFAMLLQRINCYKIEAAEHLASCSRQKILPRP